MTTPPPASTGSGNTVSNLATLLKITPRISQKLKDENDYPAWVVEAKRQLRRQKLLDLVEKRDPKPATNFSSWEDKSNKALDYLMDSCETEAQLKIRACETAHEAWKILKETYEGQTRIHLTALFANIVHLKYDDRKDGTLPEHITTFKSHWLKLSQAAATGEAGSLAADIRTFVQSDGWKASLLLATLPRFQPYANIIDNITSKEDKPTYANTVMRLREIPPQIKRLEKNNEYTEPPAAFASFQKYNVRTPCAYCKKQGYPGTSHEEKDCRSKKRDQTEPRTIKRT